ncbi:hypothetical protein A5724_19240 [Mycobacterium sp. ACS1612]|uniref:hypothetical protein n=1 Tax=Mycobacterium sp. ACS1612 TaxID=1834117 RepID=UPI0007FECD31|nr:hypothetical protein [Mycobacterium sp. ACS1612]OBF33686.1 hypothetical protein A5724_19240 [Mycobacterium sp. ACS1612]
MTELQDRPRFYEGQYLSAADLTAAVDYTRTQRARLLLGAHRWGIALGLDLVEVPGPNASLDVVIQPGYAWDGFGRPIVVAEPAKLSTGLFASFDATVVPDNPPPAALPVEVWIRYDETLGQGPRRGFETCDATSAYSRVTERFAIEVGPRTEVSARRDPIEIAGRTMDAAQALRVFDPAAPEFPDADVPHQNLPGEGDFALWLLPLGVVMYQPGNPGRFVKRDEPAKRRHARSRQYVGVVAGSVEATGGVVRIHDRARPYSPFSTTELLCVEGDIRADGDVRLFGHKVEFVASHAEDPRAPFQVLREDDPAARRAALTLVIGEKQAGDNRFVVARRSGTDPSGQDQHEAKFVVTDKGEVGIGTDNPKALLHLAEQGLQIGASSTATDNFRIQSNTDGPRALRFYNLGSGAPLTSLTASGRLGIGEKAPTNPLHVAGADGIRQNAMYVSGDSRWSSLSFNAHHDRANATWVFPDPSKPAVTVEMDALDGGPRFEVYSTVPGDNQQWASRLMVDGHSGRVGVGTRTPSVSLDVVGDLRFANLYGVGSTAGIRVVWGAVDASGAALAGDGFTAANAAGNGRYELTFTPPFTGQPTLVVTRVHQSLTANNGNAVTASETAVVDQVLADSAVIATADTDGARADGGFTFVAIGPR